MVPPVGETLNSKEITKVQDTNYKQISNLKQTMTKRLEFEIWLLVIVWLLFLGYWLLSPIL
jgi:hypothetical protein